MRSPLLLWSVLAGCAAMADEPLFQFAETPAPESFQTTDATVSGVAFGEGRGLRIVTGHTAEWPGVTLPAPGGHWDLSRRAWVALAIRNTGTTAVRVACRVDNPGANGVKNCVTGFATAEPGATATLQVPLRHRAVGAPPVEFFGMRGSPYHSSPEGTLDTRQVTGIVVFVMQPSEDYTFEIGDVRAGGEHQPVPPWPADRSFLPFIDTFGQYAHGDWPGKVTSLADLESRIATEAADLAAHPGPAGWNRYGGWADGPQLTATGFFRTEKYQGKWWLVDPEGHLFFSQGIDCIGLLDATPIVERESWFADYPGADPELHSFEGPARATHGHYAGQNPVSFRFGAANLQRKYGAEWPARAAEVAHRRLRSWGLNTIGNWSNQRIWSMKQTPYTVNVWFPSPMITGSEGYWGKFRDPFDPGFRTGIEQAMAGQADQSANDPWCLGYFVDNEIGWGSEQSLGLAALASPPDQAAKVAFLADLRARYDDIARLNAAWGTDHASWEALAASTTPPDAERAGDDLAAFYTHLAETYFRTIREAIKAVAPQQLYLGCRFAWVNPLAAAAAAGYCDVVSYNLYRHDVANFKPPIEADVPLIIGEFHFGALDRGMFHTGLVPVDTQAARAAAYQQYVEGALDNPLLVGCHWFQYQDEPTTGRVLDGENYQIGFVDITDTPYPETIAAARTVGAGMYARRLGGTP